MTEKYVFPTPVGMDRHPGRLNTFSARFPHTRGDGPRTTFTTFDSLFMIDGEYGYPSPLVDPSPASAGYTIHLDKLVEEGFDEFIPYTVYLEIQVHGGVTLEDIEIIEFRGPIFAGEKRELEKRGIKWIEIE